MVDPGEQHGGADPHQDDATQPGSRDHHRLNEIRRRIWRAFNWPRRWWRSVDHNRRTANATVLLALGTLALALVNLGMLVEMRRGTKAQHEDTVAALGRTDSAIATTNRLADESAKIAKAGQDTAATARQSLVTSERAYLLPRALLSLKPAGQRGNLTWRYEVPLENTGNTPAIDLLGYTMSAVSPVRLAEDNVFVDVGTVPPSFSYIVAPHRDIKQGPIEFSQAQMRMMQQGKMFGYIWGWLVYRDIIDQSKIHLTMWCHEIIEIIGDPLSGKGEAMPKTRFCRVHNCIDDQCGQAELDIHARALPQHK